MTYLHIGIILPGDTFPIASTFRSQSVGVPFAGRAMTQAELRARDRAFIRRSLDQFPTGRVEFSLFRTTA